MLIEVSEMIWTIANAQVGGSGAGYGGGRGFGYNFTDPAPTPFSLNFNGTPSFPNVSFAPEINISYDTSDQSRFGFGASHLPRTLPEGAKEMSAVTRDLLFFFHYSFQILYECRAILLAAIGSVLKYKVCLL